MVPDSQKQHQSMPEQERNLSLDNNSNQDSVSIELLFRHQRIKQWKRFFNRTFGYSASPLVSLRTLLRAFSSSFFWGGVGPSSFFWGGSPAVTDRKVRKSSQIHRSHWLKIVTDT